MKRLSEVNPDNVVRAARTYMRDIQFVYVGDTLQIRHDFVRGM